jgi:hypothetical protein
MRSEHAMSARQQARDAPRRYRIRVQGHVDLAWSDWFGGMELRNEADGTTAIVGTVLDQAALFGLLSRVRDLGLGLLAVRLEGPGV